MTARGFRPDLAAYRRFVVAFSGGKDSLAALLLLLDLGVPPEAIELHHHDVDGGGPTFMDWPCTGAYVRAIVDHLGIALFGSWREGGFARELDRAGAPTASSTGPNAAYGTRSRGRASDPTRPMCWAGGACRAAPVFSARLINGRPCGSSSHPRSS